jgi:uncharacterized alpha-E superfamily protein
VVALFDSTITFHAQYQQRHDIPALLDLLVLDRDNPRSLGWVVQTLRGRLARLAGLGTDAAYVPFESQNEKGEIVGFDIEVVQAVAQKPALK